MQVHGKNAIIDTLAHNNGMPFSTYDNDNDRSNTNCATERDGGG